MSKYNYPEQVADLLMNAEGLRPENVGVQCYVHDGYIGGKLKDRHVKLIPCDPEGNGYMTRLTITVYVENEKSMGVFSKLSREAYTLDRVEGQDVMGVLAERLEALCKDKELARKFWTQVQKEHASFNQPKLVGLPKPKVCEIVVPVSLDDLYADGETGDFAPEGGDDDEEGDA